MLNNKSSPESESLISKLSILKHFIFNLLIKCLPSHIDVYILFTVLTNLTSISLTYGLNNNS